MKTNIVVKNITTDFCVPIQNEKDSNYFFLYPGTEITIKDIKKHNEYIKSIKVFEGNGILEVNYETEFSRFEIMDI